MWPISKLFKRITFFLFTTIILFVSCKTSIDENLEEQEEQSSETTEEQTTPQESTQTEEEPNTLTFTLQPTVTVVSINQSAVLTCAAECGKNPVTYQWYTTSDGTTEKGIAVTDTDGTGAQTNSFTTTTFTEKEIRYYYCVATSKISDTETQTVTSNVIAAAYTGLPIIRLNTDCLTSEITKDEYIQGDIEILSDDYNFEKYTFTKKKEGVKGRGNSSWGMPKKSYNIKFSTAQSLFNLPESKKWALIANYSDKSLLRNKIASLLGTEIFNNEWNPHFVNVDLIMNDEYLGNYTLCEKNTIGNGRIDIQDISDIEKNITNGNTTAIEDANGDGILDLNDGGFVVEIDPIGRISADDIYVTGDISGKHFVLKDPDNISDAVKEKVNSIIQITEEALYGEDFEDSEIGWRKYIDEESVIDWYFANEFTKNNDAIFFSSVYLYYNPADSKIHLGPNWDFDISCGNINYNGCDNASGWWIRNAAWISRLFQDPLFISNLKNRWNEKKSELSTFIYSDIQTLANENATSAQVNFLRWQILGTYVWPNPAGYDKRTTYQSEIDYLKTWLYARFFWLDNAINAL